MTRLTSLSPAVNSEHSFSVVAGKTYSKPWLTQKSCSSSLGILFSLARNMDSWPTKCVAIFPNRFLWVFMERWSLDFCSQPCPIPLNRPGAESGNIHQNISCLKSSKTFSVCKDKLGFRPNLNKFQYMTWLYRTSLLSSPTHLPTHVWT